MPRNMSFYLTTDQVRNRTKTVTRRSGWQTLKPGTVVNACVKCMGLKAGETVERICQIRIVNVRREPLKAIIAEGQAGADREGFPSMTPEEFVAMFCHHMGGDANQDITRIEFEYVDPKE